jgi:uncharacterized protein
MEKSKPQAFLESWEELQGPAIFATVDKEGSPNVVYVGCFKLINNSRIVIANNKFHKTQKNIHNGSYGSFLFITKDGKSYQVKGKVKNHTEGKIYEGMKGWLDPKYPGHSAVVLDIEEIYSGSEKLL